MKEAKMSRQFNEDFDETVGDLNCWIRHYYDNSDNFDDDDFRSFVTKVRRGLAALRTMTASRHCTDDRRRQVPAIEANLQDAIRDYESAQRDRYRRRSGSGSPCRSY
jgi:hypothetical protein